MTSSASPSEDLLATCATPSGNLFQLLEEDGRFALVTFTRSSRCEVTEADARAWYKTTGQCGGKLHRRFPGGTR